MLFFRAGRPLHFISPITGLFNHDVHGEIEILTEDEHDEKRKEWGTGSIRISLIALQTDSDSAHSLVLASDSGQRFTCRLPALPEPRLPHAHATIAHNLSVELVNEVVGAAFYVSQCLRRVGICIFGLLPRIFPCFPFGLNPLSWICNPPMCEMMIVMDEDC